MQLEDKMPLGQQVPQQRIFVRECYTVIFEKIWNFYDQSQGPTTVTLTGTPGIGKSLFGLLFLIELIRFLRIGKASCGNLCGGVGLGLNGGSSPGYTILRTWFRPWLSSPATRCRSSRRSSKPHSRGPSKANAVTEGCPCL